VSSIEAEAVAEVADRGVIGDDEVVFKERRGWGGVIVGDLIGHVLMNRRRADCGGGKRTQLAQAFSERDVWIDGTVLTRGKGMHCNSTTPEPSVQYSTVQYRMMYRGWMLEGPSKQA
jgi:hypothetical protein